MHDDPHLNAVGDLVLTDPGTLHALADADRLTLFDLVRRNGPVTSATLAERSHRDESTVEGHLRTLEALGLVEQSAAASEVHWASTVKGIYFEIPDDPQGQRAARQLSNVMLTKYADLPGSWAREEEPRLELEWARAAGLFNARVELTPEEVRWIQEELERLLAPFTTRSLDDGPTGARSVRILAFFMPEAEPPG
jgi:predicted transcriptional regulator